MADTCGVGQCGTLNRMKEKLHWGDVPFSIWGVRIAALILIEIVEMFLLLPPHQKYDHDAFTLRAMP